MYTIIKTIYQRIKREPTTSFFLIIGFALAMLMVSMGTSYVTELVRASDDKKNYAPPNGDQLVIKLYIGFKTFVTSTVSFIPSNICSMERYAKGASSKISAPIQLQ